MIDVQLPDGRRVRVDTDDPQAAARAGRLIWQREQAEREAGSAPAAPARPAGVIDIQLPNGELVRVETDDVQAAVRAGRLYWQKSQAAKGLSSELAPPIMPSQPGEREIPWYEQPAGKPMPGASPRDPASVERALTIGTQGVGRGLAELAGAPVDIASAVLNAAPWAIETGANLLLPDEQEISLPRITRPIGGSQQIRELAATGATAAGVPLVDEADMSRGERLAYNVNRMGTGAIAGAGVGQGLNATARVGSGLHRYTQPFANPTLRSASVDVAAGTGAGTALTASQELFPDSPIADLVATLAGGLVGGRGMQIAQSPGAAARAAERALPDPSVAGATRRQADRAAEMVQSKITNPREEVAETIAGVADEAVRQGDPTPTAGIASGDIGLMALERGARLRDPVPFQVRDQQLRDAAQERVIGLRDESADPRAAQRFAERDVAEQRAAAQKPVAEARQQLAETQAKNTEQLAKEETARERSLLDKDQEALATRGRFNEAEEAERALGGEAASRRGGEVAASENMAGAVSTAKEAAEARKAGLYREAETLGRESTVDPAPFAETARAIRDEISPLAQHDAQLSNILDDLDRLAPVGEDGVAAAAKPITATDLIAMRPRLSAARAAAVKLKRGDVIDRLGRINEGIADELNSMADAGDPAALKWREAETNFREDFAPRFRQGVGADLDRAERTGRPTPATAVAGKFLRPGAGGKEAAEDLQRILSGAASEQQGLQAAREYVLADLARTVGADNKINPSRLREWIANREGMFQAMPGLREEVQATLQNVINRREATTGLQRELDSLTSERRTMAVSTQKEINQIRANNRLSETEKQAEIAKLERRAAEVEKEIQNDAASVLLDADPIVAAKRVFASKDPERTMAAIVKKLERDADAAKGWKEAVTEHLIDRVTTTNTALTGGAAEGPVSIANLQKFFAQHEKALAKVFAAPGEMNALRRAHKILEPLGNLRRQATVGSQTVENEQAWNAFEAGLLAVTGNAITTGMIMRRIKVVLKLLPGRQRAIDHLVNRMFFDPELAQHLLTRDPKKIELPAWNKRLTRLLAAGEAAREAIDEVENRSEE